MEKQIDENSMPLTLGAVVFGGIAPMPPTKSTGGENRE
jgi:hypothetical protein